MKSKKQQTSAPPLTRAGMSSIDTQTTKTSLKPVGPDVIARDDGNSADDGVLRELMNDAKGG